MTKEGVSPQIPRFVNLLLLGLTIFIIVFIIFLIFLEIINKFG